MKLEDYLSKNSKKHLIFDFDLTLVKLHLPWEKTWGEMYEKLHTIDVPLMEKYGTVSYPIYNEMIKKHGQKVRELIQNYYAEFEDKDLTGVDINRELFDFIKNNHKKYQFYIWSSNQKLTINRILKDNDLIIYFSKIISANDVDFFKPNRYGFDEIFDLKTQKKENYLIIGDSENDRKAAKNSGIDYFYLHI